MCVCALASGGCVCSRMSWLTSCCSRPHSAAALSDNREMRTKEKDKKTNCALQLCLFTNEDETERENALVHFDPLELLKSNVSEYF